MEHMFVNPKLVADTFGVAFKEFANPCSTGEGRCMIGCLVVQRTSIEQCSRNGNLYHCNDNCHSVKELIFSSNNLTIALITVSHGRSMSRLIIISTFIYTCLNWD